MKKDVLGDLQNERERDEEEGTLVICVFLLMMSRLGEQAVGARGRWKN